MTDTNSEATIRQLIEAPATAVRTGDVEAMMVDVADEMDIELKKVV